MKNQIFKIAAILILFSTLFSCRTAEELIQKAKEKDPNIILCKDSIIETKLPGETITIHTKDTARIETKRVSILAIADSLGITLSYTLKDTVISSTETTPVITPKKSRQQIRQENKTERNKDDENAKTARKKEGTKKKEIKQGGKSNRTTIRQENKKGNWFDFLLIGIAIGAAAMWLLMVKVFRR